MPCVLRSCTTDLHSSTVIPGPPELCCPHARAICTSAAALGSLSLPGLWSWGPAPLPAHSPGREDPPSAPALKSHSVYRCTHELETVTPSKAPGFSSHHIAHGWHKKPPLVPFGSLPKSTPEPQDGRVPDPSPPSTAGHAQNPPFSRPGSAWAWQACAGARVKGRPARTSPCGGGDKLAPPGPLRPRGERALASPAPSAPGRLYWLVPVSRPALPCRGGHWRMRGLGFGGRQMPGTPVLLPCPACPARAPSSCFIGCCSRVRSSHVQVNSSQGPWVGGALQARSWVRPRPPAESALWKETLQVKNSQNHLDLLPLGPSVSS